MTSRPSTPGADPHPQPGISVVIPTHNYAHFLPCALASVLGQTWKNLEVLVVDDGSGDATREIVARIPDPRLRYFWQENSGLSAARNHGIHHARHAFIAFLDADDRWQPEFLARVMEQFASLDESYAMVATAHHRIDRSGAVIHMPQLAMQQTQPLTAEDFCMRNRPFASSIVVRHGVFEKCGAFDPSLSSSEDRDLWIRATAAGFGFWFLHEPLAQVRRHAGNMSKNAVRMKTNSRAVLIRSWRNGAVSRLRIGFWLRAFSVHYFQSAWTHFDAGHHYRALLYLATSCALWPYFLRPTEIYERPLFRIRSAWHFLRRVGSPR